VKVPLGPNRHGHGAKPFPPFAITRRITGCSAEKIMHGGDRHGGVVLR